jgi:[methyl-Co(III) methanol-specific corrinoid protein]:coenzyme M methyltransferase
MKGLINFMTGKERALACLFGHETDRPTVINPTSIATSESCRKIGVNFQDVHLDPDKMAALAAIGHDGLGFDSVMPYFSVVHEAAALGCIIDWGNIEDMPKQKNHPFADPEQFAFPNDFLDSTPIKTILEAIRLLRKKLGEKALIIGKVMGPWTLSYHLHGVEDTLIDSIEDEEKICEFIERFSEITKTFAQAQFEAGADVITLADHATADLVSPGTYRDILLPAHKKITQFFHGDKIILHCCGNTLDRIAYFAQAGFAAFHFDSKNDINQAIKAAGDMKLTGCVNNVEVLLNGNQETVAHQTENIINSGINIVSPECAIPLQIKNANLAEIVKTAERFRK